MSVEADNVSPADTEAIEEAVAVCVSKVEVGEPVERVLHHLARGLKAVPPLAKGPLEGLRPILQDFQERLREQGLADDDIWSLWRLFVRKWERVKEPCRIIGPERLWTAARQTLKDPPGEAVSLAKEFFMDSAGMRRTMAVCIAIQDLMGQYPFFIFARKGAELLGTSHESFAANLRDLKECGILKEVKPGRTRTSPRLQWIGLAGYRKPRRLPRRSSPKKGTGRTPESVPVANGSEDKLLSLLQDPGPGPGIKQLR